MSTSYTVDVKRFDPSDPRLGRHVRHDSRSLNYLVEAKNVSTLQSVTHDRYIPILDQDNYTDPVTGKKISLGSCTGNAGAGCMGTSLFFPSVSDVLSTSDADSDESYAVALYSDATKADSYSGTYLPTDTGSDGLAIATVLKARGLISGYQHATSFEAFLTALAAQPVIVGTEWRGDMFNPALDGRIKTTGAVEGGHEYLLRELDVENKRVWMDNSWNTSWGVKGRGYFTWDDFEALLSADGDCTVFTPISQPAPTPTPPTPENTLADVATKYRRFRRAFNSYLADNSVG